MKYAIVYDSSTGNTARLAQAIATALPSKDCLYFGEVPATLPDVDMVFVGFWTYKGDCTPQLATFLSSLRAVRVFLFGTAGFGGSNDYFASILDRVSASIGSSNTLVGSFMCQGRMPEGVRKCYEDMLAENPDDDRVRMMMENFDVASVHPGEQDEKQVCSAALRALLGER